MSDHQNLPDPEALARLLVQVMNEAEYGHLERRWCTADAPMPMADKDAYRWSHPDAAFIEPFFNVGVYRCPHCNFTFTALPRPQ